MNKILSTISITIAIIALVITLFAFPYKKEKKCEKKYDNTIIKEMQK